MKTIGLDVRERILRSYDQPGRTRAEVARWFGVSLGMVKKLLQQRRRLGEIGSLHHRAGRKPMITAAHSGPVPGLVGQTVGSDTGGVAGGHRVAVQPAGDLLRADGHGADI